MSYRVIQSDIVPYIVDYNHTRFLEQQKGTYRVNKCHVESFKVTQINKELYRLVWHHTNSYRAIMSLTAKYRIIQNHSESYIGIYIHT